MALTIKNGGYAFLIRLDLPILNLPMFTANETITNLTQHELSQGESDLLKASLYFSIQPDKIRKSEIFIPLKRFIVRFLTTSNLRKPKVR